MGDVTDCRVAWWVVGWYCSGWRRGGLVVVMGGLGPRGADGQDPFSTSFLWLLAVCSAIAACRPDRSLSLFFSRHGGDGRTVRRRSRVPCSTFRQNATSAASPPGMV